MRWVRTLALWTLLIGLATVGCGPELSEEELGTIQYEVPKVPGADQPYELPPVSGAEADDAGQILPPDDASSHSSDPPAAPAMTD